MEILVVILALLIVLVIGFITILRKNKENESNLDFTYLYQNKFAEMSKKYLSTFNKLSFEGQIDNDLYVWLTKNVSRIHKILGVFGIMEYYSDPIARQRISNYHIIINTLPKFQNHNIQKFDINSTNDCLIRFCGELENRITLNKKELKNPILWFRYGIQIILTSPLLLLNWFGIIGKKRVNEITENVVFKFVSGIVSLIGFLSGLVTIIAGYDEVVQFFNKIFGNE